MIDADAPIGLGRFPAIAAKGPLREVRMVLGRLSNDRKEQDDPSERVAVPDGLDGCDRRFDGVESGGQFLTRRVNGLPTDVVGEHPVAISDQGLHVADSERAALCTVLPDGPKRGMPLVLEHQRVDALCQARRKATPPLARLIIVAWHEFKHAACPEPSITTGATKQPISRLLGRVVLCRRSRLRRERRASTMRSVWAILRGESRGRSVAVLAMLGLAACSGSSATSVSRVLPSVVPLDLVGQVRKYVYAERPDGGSFTIIGSAGSKPFGSADAVVEVDLHSAVTSIDDGNTIRSGQSAMVTENSVPGGTSRSVVWNENLDTRVTARSLTLSRAQLLQLVDALAIANDTVSIDASASTLRVVGTVPLPIDTSGYSVTYGTGDRYLNVDVHGTRGDELTLYRWGPSEPATIGGRAVLHLLAERGAVAGYVFEYRPGLIVRVAGSVSDEELRQAVVSLRPIDDDTYSAIPTSP